MRQLFAQNVCIPEIYLLFLHKGKAVIELKTYIMIDYDILDINEAIEGLSYEEQIKYLDDREDEINEAIEELNTLLSDVEERKAEIEDQRQKETCDKVLQALNNAGYNIPLDENGNLSFAFEEATITIFMCFSGRIDFDFKVDRNQLTYRKMISSLVPDYKQDGNFFYKTVSEETLCEEIVSLVKRLKSSVV